MSHILYEPFRIKSVEYFPETTLEDRRKWIRDAHFNVFSLVSRQVTIDLLTDSGTAAMSDHQWAAMMDADEAYAGSSSFLELQQTVQELTGHPFVLPTHQGRAAEHLLFSAVLKPGHLVLSNGLFDTTLGNIQSCGAEGRNLPIAEARDPFVYHSFKGNIDLEALEKTLGEEGERIPLVVMTVTNNTGGGQPVSLANLQAAAEIVHRHRKMLVLDACRFAENAYFVKTREESQSARSAREIAQDCFALADAITFSGKKDALANIGGLLCLRDQKLSEELKNRMLIFEGFPTYGGLAGYSLAAMNQGLKEVLDERYLRYRLRTISWTVEKMKEKGVPVLEPAGGHAIYIEAARLFPHIPRSQFPGITLTSALYELGGIRGVELGTVAFGSRDKDGRDVFPPLELVRLAVPRRVYTEAHMGYVAEVAGEIAAKRESFKGFEFLEEAPVMRHFRSKFRQRP